MTTEHISEPDLDWLAFQYAAGELHGPELEAFEKLLATDERTCTALAQAVLLGQAVVHCEQSTPVVARPVAISRTQRHSLIAMATVACSLLFVGWLSMQVPQQSVSNEASTVASLWINGADEVTTNDLLLPDTQPADLTEDEPIPGWLLAAVTTEQAADEQIMND